ncbi:lens fiber membrane intrinsic protein-like [Clavelina lepadiformis]|uniref:lens fiber membrane intrinsic protein-like n=1 Tax=Clavelina lepadiformis TaxID=159417 RepID=UPI00404236AE
MALATTLQISSMVCGWVAMSLGIASLAVHTWVDQGLFGRSGLFKTCLPTVCFYISDPPSFLMATRAFLIMGVISIFAGNIAMIAFRVKCQKRVGQIAAVLLLLGGALAIIATAIYTGKVDLPADYYGSGFILAWVTCGLALLASILGFASLKHA